MEEKTKLTESKDEDPTKYYRVKEKLMEGGQGTLYEVERISDKKRFAMKLIQPDSDWAKENALNEIAIMQMNQGEEILSI